MEEPMQQDLTICASESATLGRWFAGRKGAAALSLCLSLLVCAPVADAAALPSADEVLKELRISDSDKQSIMEGKIVKWTATEGSDRELAIGMAFLIKTKPENLVQIFREAGGLKKMSAITARGRIAGDGTLVDFAGVKLMPNGEKEARRYLEAEPGDALNLDTKEIAAFRALKAAHKGGAVPVKEVEALVRQTLLSRHQAYRSKGLAGISPYERGDGHHLNPSDELSISSKQMQGLAKFVPVVSDTLLNYPASKPKDLEEQFMWLNIDVFGRPTYVLSHRMLFRIGEQLIAADRHFYTSHDYNSMQQGVAALPITGGTLMIYLGRVSTDQVAGFGSGAKHPVSRALMGPYLEDLFENVRTMAEKR